jgi:hypothetical protein
VTRPRLRGGGTPRRAPIPVFVIDTVVTRAVQALDLAARTVDVKADLPAEQVAAAIVAADYSVTPKEAG